MGLRGLQERQSHGQLSSAFLEGLDKLNCAEYPPCRLRRNNETPSMQTDEPAVHLSGESCVGRAAPLLKAGIEGEQRKRSEGVWSRQEEAAEWCRGM